MPSEPAPSAPPSPILQRALSWPVLAVIAALPSIAAWASGKSLAWRDSSSLYGPIRGLVTDALRAGSLPLWNPFEGTGQPLFAEGIHGVLHPLSILTAILDPGGLDLLIALYVVSAALGAFVLARALGLERQYAFLGGIAFALSGFVLSMTGNLVFLAGAASMPWQVAALAAAGRGASFGLPLAAAATAVTAFSGDAQMAAISAILGGALAFERTGWRGVGRAVAATALGGLVAAVQILPTLAAIGVSERGAGLSEAEQTLFSFTPLRLVELVVPGFLFRFDEVTASAVFRWFGGPASFGFDMPFAPSVYLGIPVVALVAAAPLRERRVRLLAAASILLLWLALGHFAGARQALGWLPIWGKFRYSEKLVAPFSLALALLAAFGAREVEAAGAARRRVTWSALAGVGATLIALAIASVWPDAPERGRRVLQASLVGALPHVLLGGAAVVALVLVPRLARWRALGLGAATAASLLAGVPFAGIRMPGEPCHVWPGSLAADGPRPRIYVPYDQPRIPRLDQPRSLPTWRESIVSDDCGRSHLGIVAHNVRDRIDNIWSYGALGSDRLVKLVAALPDHGDRSLRYFSVTHASIIRPIQKEEWLGREAAVAEGRLVARDDKYAIELHAVPHLPWARFAPQAAVARDVDEAAGAFAVVAASERDVAVVESDGPVPAGRGVVRGVLRETERISVEVDVLSEGLLVVNDAFWPGWVARIDGREAPIFPANVIARGVIVPAGRHVVTMDYEPSELRVGLMLSLAGIAVSAGIALFEERRRRRTR